MKKRYFLLLLLLVFGCSRSLEVKEAVLLTDSFIKEMKDEKYNSLLEYYTKDFFKTTSSDEWINSLKRMKEEIGTIQSYRLISSNINNNIGRQNNIVLVFEMSHQKSKSVHTFTVISENNQYKILGHDVKVDIQ